MEDSRVVTPISPSHKYETLEQNLVVSLQVTPNKRLKRMFPEKVLHSNYLWHGLSKMVAAAWLFPVGSSSKQTSYTFV